MLEAGEDVRFLCRRLLILASEDIGNADPQALLLATAAMQACEFVGLPECQFALAQATLYLALCPKSNACTTAIAQARRDVREARIVPVPRLLRDSHSAAARTQGRGTGYVSPHDLPEDSSVQQYLGIDAEYYAPSSRGFEAELRQRLLTLRDGRRPGSNA
jgi:putative ATPase